MLVLAVEALRIPSVRANDCTGQLPKSRSKQRQSLSRPRCACEPSLCIESQRYARNSFRSPRDLGVSWTADLLVITNDATLCGRPDSHSFDVTRRRRMVIVRKYSFVGPLGGPRPVQHPVAPFHCMGQLSLIRRLGTLSPDCNPPKVECLRTRACSLATAVSNRHESLDV